MGKKIQKQVNTPDLTDRIFDLFDSIAMKDYRETFRNAILLVSELDKNKSITRKPDNSMNENTIFEAEIVTKQIDILKSEKAKMIN